MYGRPHCNVRRVMSCCADQVTYEAKNLRQAIALPFNITKTGFFVIACFRTFCHRYRKVSLQGYCSCVRHGTLCAQQHPETYYNMFVTLSFFVSMVNVTLEPHYLFTYCIFPLMTKEDSYKEKKLLDFYMRRLR